MRSNYARIYFLEEIQTTETAEDKRKTKDPHIEVDEPSSVDASSC